MKPDEIRAYIKELFRPYRESVWEWPNPDPSKVSCHTCYNLVESINPTTMPFPSCSAKIRYIYQGRYKIHDCILHDRKPSDETR